MKFMSEQQGLLLNCLTQCNFFIGWLWITSTAQEGWISSSLFLLITPVYTHTKIDQRCSPSASVWYPWCNKRQKTFWGFRTQAICSYLTRAWNYILAIIQLLKKAHGKRWGCTIINKEHTNQFCVYQASSSTRLLSKAGSQLNFS